MAEVFGEYYVDTISGHAQVPCYEKWFKWTKYGSNIASAVLAVGTILVEIGESTLTVSWAVTTFFVLATFVRVLEVVKESIPLVWGQSIPHIPWCCERRDQARDADRIQKYCSCLILSPVIAGLALALFALRTTVLGGCATGVVCILDTLMGLWVVYWDEWVKDFRRVRQRPQADFELDDALDDPAGEGEQIGLTAMPVPLSSQASSFAYQKAGLSGGAEADAVAGLRTGSHTQKGKFNMANWDQSDSELS